MPRDRKTWIIYPEYFDKSLSRSDCRKVPVESAVSSPDVETIGDILDSWDIPNRVEKHEHHPAEWYQENGRVIIPKQKGSKRELLKKISEELKEREN